MWKAATLIQAHWRGARVRTQVRQLHAAATTIQAHARAWRQRAQFQKLCRSVVILQRHVRGWRVRLQLGRSKVCIQVCSSEQQQAGICAQSQACAHAADGAIAHKSWPASSVALMLKGAEDVRLLTCPSSHGCTESAQHCMSMPRLSSLLQECEACLPQAAVEIQRLWRGHAVRRLQHGRRSAAVLIQACWRGRRCAQQYMSPSGRDE